MADDLKLPEIEAFRTLITSYRRGVAKSDEDIAASEARLSAIRLELAAEEQNLAAAKVTRTKRLAMLEGVKSMVRVVEDHDTKLARESEDQGDI